MEPAKRNHHGLAEPAKRNNTEDHGVDNYGVNEEELNMMKSIIDKLLEKETSSEIVSSEAEPSEDIHDDASVVDGFQVDDNEEDQDSDEDDLVINIVGKSSKRGTLLEDWGQKTSITNQDCLVSEPESSSNTNPQKQEIKRANQFFDKKRKECVLEDKPNDTIPSKKKRRKDISHDSPDDLAVINTKSVYKDSGSMQLSSDGASLNKSAWKALVSEKGNTAFTISDILTNHNSDIDAKPGSDIATKTCSDGINDQQDQTSKHEELKKLSDVNSTEPTTSDDLLARGASWKRKSSWLQLDADTNASAFNLSQILPDVTFQTQESQQFKVIDFSDSSRGRQHKSVDAKSCAENIDQSQGPVNTRNPIEDVLTKERNTGGPVGEQLNSHSTVNVGEESSAPMLGTKLLPSNRPMGELVISETCPFMKSAASMKE